MNAEVPEYESDHYDALGDGWAEAWTILRDKFDVPPSLDVFQKGLKDSKQDNPAAYARVLVAKGK